MYLSRDFLPVSSSSNLASSRLASRATRPSSAERSASASRPSTIRAVVPPRSPSGRPRPFGSMPRDIVSIADHRFELRRRQPLQRLAVDVEHARDVGEEAPGCPLSSATATSPATVSAFMLSSWRRAFDADRRDDGHVAALEQRRKQRGVDSLDLADEAQIGPSTGDDAGAVRAATGRPPVPPSALMPATSCLFTSPASTATATGSASSPVTRRPSTKRDSTPMDVQPAAHHVAAAVNDDDAVPLALQRDDVVERGVAALPGAAANLDDDGLRQADSPTSCTRC